MNCNMKQFVRTSLILLASVICGVFSQCLDINGRTIAEDVHYVPGPDACTLCVCEKGLPSICKAVLCSPPTECQSFSRVGKSCCNFTCLDDAIHKREELNTDFGLRLAASGAAALLTLSLLLLIFHKLKQRKSMGRQTRTLRSDRRGLGGIGYITGGLSYLPDNYYPASNEFDRHIEFRYEEAPSHMSLWKPSGGGSYLPRGEAPPPYEEVVAHHRPELIITASSTLPNISHRTIPLNLTAPGTIRIIHPQSRVCQEQGIVTLPRTPAKPTENASTLHINISGCGFHTIQSADEVAKEPEASEITEEVITADALYENMHAFEPAAAAGTSCDSSKAVQESSAEIPGPSRHTELMVETDDHDDYRSECENCKSSPGGATYYTEDEGDPPETMTLQRMPKETDEEAYYRSSVTLPAQCKQPRRVLGSREGWFTSMPESSSEDE